MNFNFLSNHPVYNWNASFKIATAESIVLDVIKYFKSMQFFKNVQKTKNTSCYFNAFDCSWKSNQSDAEASENHKKKYRNILENIRPFVSHLYGKFVEVICLKAPGNCSAPI